VEQIEARCASLGLSPEHAFAHVREPRTKANRKTRISWGETAHYLLDQGSECTRSWILHRVRHLQPGDGVFLDVQDSRTIREVLGTVQYPDTEAGQDALAEAALGLIRQVVSAVGSVELNTAEYYRPYHPGDGRPTDLEMGQAAGRLHLERFFNPTAELLFRWGWTDMLLDAGVGFSIHSTWNSESYTDPAAAYYTAGNSATSEDRGQLYFLASYYMIVGPDPAMTQFAPASGWATPLEREWIGAIDVDVGRPLERRRQVMDGTDPRGQPVAVFSREFEHALVVVRPRAHWSSERYGDDTAVRVVLPAGTWYAVDRHGTVAALPSSSIELRLAEGAIFLRKGA
jgi:hypothetical protein